LRRGVSATGFVQKVKQTNADGVVIYKESRTKNQEFPHSIVSPPLRRGVSATGCVQKVKQTNADGVVFLLPTSDFRLPTSLFFFSRQDSANLSNLYWKSTKGLESDKNDLD
jgi:hypothetical protein